jgi:protoheme IX farnesyltransferase
MTPREGWLFAILTGIIGVVMLGYWFNWMAASLSAFSLFLYAFIYTPLKKINSIAVLMGAVPGALPCLIGWVAGDDQFSLGGWILFAFQFFWQFPHFWAIAWVCHDDYMKAGFFMLPSRNGRDQSSRFQVLIYTLFLIPISLTPYLFGFAGMVGSSIVLLLGINFLIQAYRLYVKGDMKSARQLMFGSFYYLPIVQLALMSGF